LEDLASGTGIAEQARQALRGHRPQNELDALVAEDVFDAARRKEAWATTIIAGVVDYLAILISSLSAYLDPDLIVLGGGVSRSPDLLIEPILKRVEGTTPVVPRLQTSQLGYRATALGAIVNVLNYTNDFYVVHKLS
jgi:predicted NBD/HSP70 family sugar kinase